MLKIKKYIFPAITLLFSFYISLLFALGIIIGYISTHFGHKRITKIPKLQSVNINLTKNWQIHFHHWLMGLTAVLLVIVAGMADFFPRVIWGLVGGFMAHDLHQDKDWYRILLRR